MVQLMSQQNAVDQGSRQKINIDAVGTAQVTSAVPVTGTITAVTTVTTVTTCASVTNIAAIAGEGVRMYEIPARNCYSNSIRNKLTFA